MKFNSYILTFVTAILFGVYFFVPPTFSQTPLTIDNIDIQFTDKNVIISWETNDPALGRIDYAKDSYFKEHDEYNSYVQEGGSRDTTHVITLIGLQEDITYHYRITSTSRTQETQTFDQTFETDEFDDNVTPIISKVSVIHVTGKTATIQWETDEAATSKVLYGKTSKYGRSNGTGTRRQYHDITIGGLSPGALYHFQVQSKDKDGNMAVWYDDTFRTLLTDTSDREDLKIFGLRPVSENDPDIQKTTVLVSWRTSRPATGIVRYGTKPSVGRSISLPGPRSFLHSVTLKELAPGTIYYFRVESKDVLGKTQKTEVSRFVTRDVNGQIIELDDQAVPEPVVLGQEVETPTPTQPTIVEPPTVSDRLQELGATFYINFEDGFGASFSAGSKKGKPSNTADIVPGFSGNAAELLKSDAVSFSGNNNFNAPAGTVAFWFKPQWGNDSMVYTLFDAGDKESFFYLARTQNNTLTLFFEDAKGRDYKTSLSSLPRINQEEWQFVAATWEYGKTALVYYTDLVTNDVSRFQNRSLSGSPGAAPENLTKNFFIGAKSDRTSAQATIDEFTLFNRALSAAEINSLMRNGLNYLADASVQGIQYSEDILIPETIPSSRPARQYSQASVLYKSSDTGEVYSIFKGKKHYISSPGAFNEYGYNWADVRTVSQRFLDTVPDVRLVKTPDSPRVYYLYKRPGIRWIKLAIPSPAVFTSYADNRWEDIVTINSIDLNSYENVELIKLANDPKVYFVQSGTRRHINSWQTFLRAGFDPERIVTVNETHLESYALGTPFL